MRFSECSILKLVLPGATPCNSLIRKTQYFMLKRLERYDDGKRDYKAQKKSYIKFI